MLRLGRRFHMHPAAQPLIKQWFPDLAAPLGASVSDCPVADILELDVYPGALGDFKRSARGCCMKPFHFLFLDKPGSGLQA